MDREEAKTELQDLTNAIEELENSFPIKNPANQKTITALKIAIEALEQPALDLFTELSIKAIGEDEIYRIIKKEKEREKKLAANRCEDAISRQAVLDGLGKYHDGADLHIDGLTYAYDLVCKLPTVSTEISELLHKAKSEIRRSETKAYNADFTAGCEYAIGVIERMFEEVEE